MVAALRDVNGRYVGNRPVRLKKSNWKELINRAFDFNHRRALLSSCSARDVLFEDKGIDSEKNGQSMLQRAKIVLRGCDFTQLTQAEAKVELLYSTRFEEVAEVQEAEDQAGWGQLQLAKLWQLPFCRIRISKRSV